VAPSPNFSPFLRSSLVLIGLAWTVPFLQPVHRFPLTAFYSEWLAFALGLAAAAPLMRRESWRDAALPAVALAPLGLIAVLGLQVALGRVPYAGQALMAGLYLLWAVLLIVLGQLLRREVSLVQIATFLAWFLVAGGFVHALVGLAQHFGLHDPPLDALIARKQLPSVFGNLGQFNHYAASITLALASAAFLYCQRSLPVAAAAASAALFLPVLALTGSRSPWLYLAALLGLAFLLDRLQRSDESRRLAVFTAWLIPGFIAAQLLVTLPFLHPAGAPIVTSADRVFEVASGVRPRLQLWSEGWRMFLDAPLIGAGFGQFAWEHFLHQAADGAAAAPGVFNHAHNIVVQLLAETGVAGALIAAAAVVVWIADLRNVKLAPEWWWLLALLSVIGIHSMLEYPLWYAYFLGVAALLLGLGAERRIAVRHGGGARVATALLVLLGCVNLVAVMPPYRDFERLVFGSAAPAPAGAQAFTAAMMRAHRDPLLEPYVELAFALGAPPGTDGLQGRLELNTRAMRFAPVAAVVYRQALLLALAGDREAALVQLDRALRAYPADAENFFSELEELARRHPAEVMPLLELATAKLAPRSAPHGQR
jgi:O-antigen ligase